MRSVILSVAVTCYADAAFGIIVAVFSEAANTNSKQPFYVRILFGESMYSNLLVGSLGVFPYCDANLCACESL